MRLAQRLGADQPLAVPVGAVLVGRRNNPLKQFRRGQRRLDPDDTQ